MTALIAVEVEKIVRRQLNQVVLAIFLALLVVVYVLLWLATDVIAEVGATSEGVTDLRAALFLQETVPFAMLMLYSFGFVSGVVVIGANVGSEYTWNTIRTLTSAEPRRWRLLAAKMLALWGVVVGGLIVGLAVTLLTSTVITIADGKFDLSFVDASYVRESAYEFVRLLIGTAPYFGLAFLFGVVGRSSTSGIALALGVAFLEGIISGLMVLAGGTVADIAGYMLDQNADSIALAGGGPFESIIGRGTVLGDAFDRPGIWHAAIVLTIWASLFVAGTFWAFRRQDLEYQG